MLGIVPSIDVSPNCKTEQDYDEYLKRASQSNDDLRFGVWNIRPHGQHNPWQVEKEKRAGRVTRVLMAREREQNRLN